MLVLGSAFEDLGGSCRIWAEFLGFGCKDPRIWLDIRLLGVQDFRI